MSRSCLLALAASLLWWGFSARGVSADNVTVRWSSDSKFAQTLVGNTGWVASPPSYSTWKWFDVGGPYPYTQPISEIEQSANSTGYGYLYFEQRQIGMNGRTTTTDGRTYKMTAYATLYDTDWLHTYEHTVRRNEGDTFYYDADPAGHPYWFKAGIESKSTATLRVDYATPNRYCDVTVTEDNPTSPPTTISMPDPRDLSKTVELSFYSSYSYWVWYSYNNYLSLTAYYGSDSTTVNISFSDRSGSIPSSSAVYAYSGPTAKDLPLVSHTGPYPFPPVISWHAKHYRLWQFGTQPNNISGISFNSGDPELPVPLSSLSSSEVVASPVVSNPNGVFITTSTSDALYVPEDAAPTSQPYASTVVAGSNTTPASSAADEKRSIGNSIEDGLQSHLVPYDREALYVQSSEHPLVQAMFELTHWTSANGVHQTTEFSDGVSISIPSYLAGVLTAGHGDEVYFPDFYRGAADYYVLIFGAPVFRQLSGVLRPITTLMTVAATGLYIFRKSMWALGLRDPTDALPPIFGGASDADDDDVEPVDMSAFFPAAQGWANLGGSRESDDLIEGIDYPTVPYFYTPEGRSTLRANSRFDRPK